MRALRLPAGRREAAAAGQRRSGRGAHGAERLRRAAVDAAARGCVMRRGERDGARGTHLRAHCRAEVRR